MTHTAKWDTSVMLSEHSSVCLSVCLPLCHTHFVINFNYFGHLSSYWPTALYTE